MTEVDHEQVKEVDVRHHTADGRSDDPGKVTHYAQNAESLLSLFLRQDVGDHRIVRRTGNAGQQTHNDHQRIEHIELTHQTKSQGAEGAKDQPKQDQFFASKFVGQRAPRVLPIKPKSDDTPSRMPACVMPTLNLCVM